MELLALVLMHRVNIRTSLFYILKIYNLHLSVYLTLELDHKLVKLYLFHHQLSTNHCQFLTAHTSPHIVTHRTALSNKVLGQFIWKS